jgi:hypothetical protein
MIALVRHARFGVPGAGHVFLEVRRLHDTTKQRENKTFQFMRRVVGGLGLGAVSTRNFSSIHEAFRYWDSEVAKMTDQGFPRQDLKMVGFREEG